MCPETRLWYVVALSADHGFPEIPEQTLKKGRPAKRIGEKQIEDVLARVKQLADSLKGRGNNEVLTALKAYLMKLNFIADVYTPGQLNSKIVGNDKFLELYKKSRRSDRCPGCRFSRRIIFSPKIGRLE